MGKSKFNPVNIVQKTVAAVREKKDNVVSATYDKAVGNSTVLKALDKGVKTAVGTYYGGQLNSTVAGTAFNLNKDNTAGYRSAAQGGTFNAAGGTVGLVSTAAGDIEKGSRYYDKLQANDTKGLAGEMYGDSGVPQKVQMNLISPLLAKATDPGDIGGGVDSSTYVAPPSEDPAAQRAASQAAEDERRPKGIASTIFAGLNNNPNGPKPKSARKTLLGY